MLLFFFIVGLNFLFFPLGTMGGDISETMFWILSACGFLSVLLSINKLNFRLAFVFLPIFYMIFRSFFGGILGYTDLIVVRTAGVLGLAFWASRVDRKWIFRGLLISAILQIFFTYAKTINWAADYSELYSWGSMRHRIRYCTMIYAGVLSAWNIYHNKKEPLIWQITAIIGFIAGIATIVHAKSDTIILITALSLAFLILRKYGLVWGLVFTSACIMAGTALEMDGLTCRLVWWEYAFEQWRIGLKPALIGFGVGSWQLVCGIHGFPWHPHNDFLLLLYEQGLIGVLFWFYAFGISFLFGTRNITTTTVFFFLTLSFFTNSGLMYPEMFFLWVLFFGMNFNKDLENDYENRKTPFGFYMPDRTIRKLEGLLGRSYNIRR